MIHVILGGQFGSEGKGSVTSVFATHVSYDLVIRTGSPQAGHTFRRSTSELIKMRQLPVSWYFAPSTPVYVPPGAIVNKDVLANEAQMLWDMGFRGGIYVSPLAAVIRDDAFDREKFISTGTTGEGVGATRADKCLRKAVLVRDDPDFKSEPLASLVSTDIRFLGALQENSFRILIEGTQGFALSTDSDYYPYCTSTNLTVYNVLDDAGIPFGVHDVYPIVVMRTFPIRIAGNSGAMFSETSWPELRERFGSHIPDEQTTVTKKTRRVGEWDTQLARGAVRHLKPSWLVLTFADYVFPRIKELGITEAIDKWLEVKEAAIGRRFDWLGVGTGELMNRNTGAALNSFPELATIDNSKNVVVDDEEEI